MKSDICRGRYRFFAVPRESIPEKTQKIKNFFKKRVDKLTFL